MKRRAGLRPRVLPVVLCGLTGLAGLKLLGLATQGGYTLVGPSSHAGFARALTEARRNPDYAEEITGAAPAKKKEPKEEAKPAEATKSAEAPAQPLPPPQPSPAERQILEKLSERRQQLDQRAQELDLREQLLKSAEKKIEERIGAVREGDQGVEAASAEKGVSPFKPLVTIYEAMKPREAAKVFERMAPQQLATLAREMNPRKLSEILAQMTPDSAEKLTAALLRKSGVAEPAKPETSQPVAAQPRPPELEDLPRGERKTQR